jgi:hypothetical protein
MKTDLFDPHCLYEILWNTACRLGFYNIIKCKAFVSCGLYNIIKPKPNVLCSRQISKVQSIKNIKNQPQTWWKLALFSRVTTLGDRFAEQCKRDNYDRKTTLTMVPPLDLFANSLSISACVLAVESLRAVCLVLAIFLRERNAALNNL